MVAPVGTTFASVGSNLKISADSGITITGNLQLGSTNFTAIANSGPATGESLNLAPEPPPVESWPEHAGQLFGAITTMLDQHLKLVQGAKKSTRVNFAMEVLYRLGLNRPDIWEDGSADEAPVAEPESTGGNSNAGV